MFLTTNRIGTIDPAFMSRIQIAIHMEKLEFENRKVLWKNFLTDAKLHLTPGSKTELLKKTDKWARMELNGREIRNTLNIAQSIAYSRTGMDGVMSEEDLELAAGETIEFQNFFQAENEKAKKAARSVWGRQN